eukprot:5285890-Prymnesium_polylepis.2
MYHGTEGLKRITHRFNGSTANKLFCVIEEVAEHAGKANMADLKYLADASHIEIETKYTNCCNVRDHKNMVALTNYENAFGLDGSTMELSRKLFITAVSDYFSHANCRADVQRRQEAHAYFTSLNEAMADPDTLHHYFWYLRGKDLTNWNPYHYPNTDLMTMYRAEAEAIPAWFDAWSTRKWTPPAPTSDGLAD